MTDDQIRDARAAFEAWWERCHPALGWEQLSHDAWFAATERMLAVVAERDAEIARLTQELADTKDDYLRRHKDACDRFERLADLEQKLSAAPKDAQRYRWMTENYGLEVDGPKSWKFYTLIPWRPRTSDKAELDAAIDAAITATKEPKP